MFGGVCLNNWVMILILQRTGKQVVSWTSLGYLNNNNNTRKANPTWDPGQCHSQQLAPCP